MAVFLAFVFFSLALSFECSDEDEPAAVSHLQVQSALVNESLVEAGVCGHLPPEDYDKPIGKVLEAHPGEDGWCLFGAAAGWASSCAVGRRARQMRPYAIAQHDSIEEQAYLPEVPRPKKITFPAGAPFESLIVRDYHDLFCAMTGLYDNVERSRVIDDYDYLVQVSENACRKLQTKVWNYYGLSMNTLLSDPVELSDKLMEVLTNENPVEHLNQSFVDMFNLQASVECRLGNDEGALCVVAYCALRGCMLPDGKVGQVDHGECPPV
mmetsp:Transcript_1334/g.2445  ORF Transcript_1334/g.2445 Transcript_1334/m.2445 type:complete len:267 (+) Transcript_1334:59-859(+)